MSGIPESQMSEDVLPVNPIIGTEREEYLRRKREKARVAYTNDPEKYKQRAREWRAANPDTVRKKVGEYQKSHPDIGKKSRQRWYAKNKEYHNEVTRKWSRDNRDKCREYCKRSTAKRMSSPQGRLSNRMSCGIRFSLRHGKDGHKWERLVGYTSEDLKNHLEKLFMQGMSWNNMGEWEIDHKIPKSAFHYEQPEDIDFKRCWALSNLQPLWARDNLIKFNKLTEPFQPSLLIS
jgi:hypothetical protein